jgi:hypothetical protein
VTVTLDVTTRPPVDDALITVAGALVEGRPARRDVPRGTEPVDIVVAAEGYERAEVRVVPNRNREVVIPLLERTAPSASASASAPPPAPEPSPPRAPQPERATGGPRPIKPSPAKPPSGKPPKNDIITDYPF